MLEAAIPCVRYGRLHLFYSTKCKNQALNLSKGQIELPKTIISSDTCSSGWGVDHGNVLSGG